MLVTALQAAMLRKIVLNDFTAVNGMEPSSTADVDWVWANCVIENGSDRGTFTSLVNGGLAEHSGHKGRDACVTVTEAGLAAYKAL